MLRSASRVASSLRLASRVASSLAPRAARPVRPVSLPIAPVLRTRFARRVKTIEFCWSSNEDKGGMQDCELVICKTPLRVRWLGSEKPPQNSLVLTSGARPASSSAVAPPPLPRSAQSHSHPASASVPPNAATTPPAMKSLCGRSDMIPSLTVAYRCKENSVLQRRLERFQDLRFNPSNLRGDAAGSLYHTPPFSGIFDVLPGQGPIYPVPRDDEADGSA